MVFSSYSFIFVALVALLAVYYAVPRALRQGRNLVLLVFSLAFYGAGGLALLPIIIASILFNYTGAMLLVYFPKRRKTFLTLTITADLLLLGCFKYAGFLARNLNALGLPIPIPDVVLPIGISFFTFQGMSYLIDTFRNPSILQRNPFKLALYISFFPQLIAGPIVRYVDIAAEIDADRETLEDFADGMVRFCFGMAKKVLLADIFGIIADSCFEPDSAVLSVAAAWVGAIAYTLQIYFDFSGYSDMAIGLGRAFGFHFVENFRYPYISRSITEFWKRWHISLSSWFRDYVYIPLGGSRVSLWKHVRNILVVWALTGLWHGAAWNFILWGTWYGLLLLGEKFLWPGLVKKAPAVGRWLVTMVIVVVGWVFFRAESLSLALSYLSGMLGLAGKPLICGQEYYFLVEYWPEWVCGILACLPWKEALEARLARNSLVRIWCPKFAALALFALSYMRIITSSFHPFLYFNF